MSDQLESFRKSLVAHGHRKCPELKSWIGAFEELKRLLDRNKSAKKVVFIDELPWGLLGSDPCDTVGVIRFVVAEGQVVVVKGACAAVL